MAFTAARNYEHELTKAMVNKDTKRFNSVRDFLLADRMRMAIEQISADANLREAVWNAMDEIIEYAVYKEDDSLDLRKKHILSTKATLCLQRAVRGLEDARKKLLFDKLLVKFIGEIQYYREHHVFAGHLQALIMQMIEQENAVLQPFANNRWVKLLNCILENIDQLSCRNFLANLVNVPALEGTLKRDVFRHIGQVLYTFATEKKKDHLFGVFWALRTANGMLIDRNVLCKCPGEIAVFVRDVQFMSNLVYSVFMYPEDYYLAYLEGLRLLTECVDYCEREIIEDEKSRRKRTIHNTKNPVSRMIKEFGKSWYEERGIQEVDWSKEKLELERGNNKLWIMVAAFPVLWHYAIDYMYPLFFWDRVNDHPVLGDLIRAFRQRITEMSAARVVRFVDDHDIIRLILESKQYYQLDEDIQNAEETLPCLNPEVLTLARAIAKDREGIVARPHCLYLNRDLEDKFTEFLARTAMPDRSMLRFSAARE